MYTLTKSKIASGLQCTKKLWFDCNEKIEHDSHIFYIGKRLNDFSKKYYGQGLNLDGLFNLDNIISQTAKAIADKSIKVIYEAAFLKDGVLIRSDVLLRKGNEWEMIEIKASTAQKPEHISDAAIQAFVIRACGINLTSIKIGHINKDFIYKGDEVYEDLIIEVDITQNVNECENNVEKWIDKFTSIATQGADQPSVSMGTQCTQPYICQYEENCKSLLPKFTGVPINIIPRIGNKLSEEWGKKGIYDLRDLPNEVFKTPMQKMIRQAHELNKPIIN